MPLERRGRVLVLEGTPRGPAARAMERVGFELQRVTKVADALELAGKDAFEVVVLDLDVPTVDGVSMVRRLRAQGVAASVVWITSNISNELAAAAAEVGVIQVLKKPVSSNALSRVVALGVEEHRKRLSVLRELIRSAATMQSMPVRRVKNELASLLEKHEPNLKALTQEFDEMVARMRTTKARAAARSLFTAAPQAFGEAAVAGAKKHG